LGLAKTFDNAGTLARELVRLLRLSTLRQVKPALKQAAVSSYGSGNFNEIFLISSACL